MEIRRAGDIQGTPDWQLDRMFDAESERKWQEQNQPTDTEMLRLAARSLGYAIDDLDTACDSVNEAAEELVDTPEGDRIAQVLQEMEGVLKDLKAMQDKWKKAVA